MAPPECLADRYELRELLGRGGMGEVYEGWDRRLDRRVAIKLLNPDLAAQPDIRTRFEAEAQAAARLTSSKVVGIFDTGEYEGIPYIVMERLPGRTLADEMTGGPIPVVRVRAVLLDMLEALEAAHGAGIIHRDIKPSNVLLTEDGTAKIADFGIAKTDNRNLTQTGQFIGTATYLSPERLKGFPAGPESDLYSVGVVGYEALTGHRPFEADTPLGLIRAIADDPTPSVRSRFPEVPDDLADAIDTATRRDPKERFANAGEMMAVLQTPRHEGAATDTPITPVGDPGPVTAVDTDLPSPTRTQTQAPGRRNVKTNRWWPLAAGLLVLLLIMRFTDSSDEPEPGPEATATSDPAVPAVPAAQPIDGVTMIEFLGPGTLVIEQTGSDESISVEAPDDLQPLIRSDVAGGTLTLGIDPGRAPDGVGMIVYRVRVKQLNELRASGGGSIRAQGVSTDRFVMTTLGSTDTEVSGNTGRLELTLQGSGDFEGSAFQAEQVTAELNGSGSAVVAVSRTLDARLNGSGSLEYVGDPTVDQSAAGSGRVRKTG